MEAHPVILQHGAGDYVALAYELCHKYVLGLVVYVGGGAYLLYDALVHDDYGVAHGQGFLLIMGDVDKGYAQLLLHALELYLHALAELEVQRAQRLVEEQHTGAVYQRTRDCHPLLLAA